MSIVLETFQVIVKGILYTLKAVVVTFVPKKLRWKSVEGQRVLITGAGSGLGRNLALRFAEKKSVLLLWDISESSNEETASMCRELGAEVYTYVCDVSNKEKVYNAAEKVSDDVRDIDILINNAGVVSGNYFEDCSDLMIEKTMQVNTMAHFWTLKAFLPSMLVRNRGHIVTIASITGMLGIVGLVDYTASKHAAVGLDESLRFELKYRGKTGIKTTCVCPAFINTGMFKGAQTSRCGWLLGNLDPDDASDRIFSAILLNQEVLLMPRFLYFLMVLKWIVPTKVSWILMQYFHSDQAMSNFVGREKEL